MLCETVSGTRAMSMGWCMIIPFEDRPSFPKILFSDISVLSPLPPDG
jgi:hypothetical protein